MVISLIFSQSSVLIKQNFYPICQMVLLAYQLPYHFAMVTSLSPMRKEMM